MLRIDAREKAHVSSFTLDVPTIFKTLEMAHHLRITPELANMTPRDLQSTIRGIAKMNFRRLSFQHHPDYGGYDARMQKLIDAYKLARRVIWVEPEITSQTVISISITSSGLSVNGTLVDTKSGWKVKPPS